MYNKTPAMLKAASSVVSLAALSVIFRSPGYLSKDAPATLHDVERNDMLRGTVRWCSYSKALASSHRLMALRTCSRPFQNWVILAFDCSMPPTAFIMTSGRSRKAQRARNISQWLKLLEA